MSADVYSNLTIGLALKNKMTTDTLKSVPVHWVRKYGDVFFNFS